MHIAPGGADYGEAMVRVQALDLRGLVVGGVIGLVFVVFVEWLVGWARLLQPWRELPPAWIGAAALLVVLTHAARAMRVHDYFGAPVHGRRRACMRLVLRHNLFNNLLPMRSGELAFPVLMARQFGVGAGVSVPGLLWFRVLDLHSVLLFALPALLAHVPATAVAAAAIWLAVPWLLRRYARRALPYAARAGRVGRLLARGLDGVPATARVFWRTYAWTLANWGLKLAVFAWVITLFVPLGFAPAVLGAIGGELTSVLPIHGMAGMGTYEAGVVAALAPSGIAVAALVAAAVNLHLFLLGVTLVAGALAFLPGRGDDPTPIAVDDSGGRR